MKCKICDKEIEKSAFTGDILCSSECFDVNYWNKRVANFNYRNVVVSGDLYSIGDETNEPSRNKGYAGRKFLINFFDHKRGRIVTTNLWYNGKIPESHRNRLPDNASFEAAREEKNKF